MSENIYNSMSAYMIDNKPNQLENNSRFDLIINLLNLIYQLNKLDLS